MLQMQRQTFGRRKRAPLRISGDIDVFHRTTIRVPYLMLLILIS